MSPRSIRICFWGIERGRCVGLTTLPPYMSRLFRQRGIPNISQPYWPARPVTGIALLLHLHWYGWRVEIGRDRVRCQDRVTVIHCIGRAWPAQNLYGREGGKRLNIPRSTWRHVQELSSTCCRMLNKQQPLSSWWRPLTASQAPLQLFTATASNCIYFIL
jgi:hypothetical protein